MLLRLSTARILCAMLLLNLLLIESVSAAFFSVGSPSDGCQFSDLQAAINATAGATDEIHVLVDYVGKPIRVNGKSLHIFGGYPACDAPAPVPFAGDLSVFSTLDGSLDSANNPVIIITGQSSVDLRNFLVINGHNQGSNGGGISFISGGNFGHLELHAVDVAHNLADKGGGIFFNGTTAADDLVLYDSSIIEFNTANDAGGGIRIQGHTHLIAISPQTTISNNTADPNQANDGRGGGLQALDSTRADIGSAGYNGNAVIDHNHARYGGGIALHDDAVAVLAGAVPATQARVEHNDATVSGGGVYLVPTGNTFGNSHYPALCGFGYGINGNSASDGAAIYAEKDDFLGGIIGDLVDLTDESSSQGSCAPIMPVVCALAGPCNTINNNSVTQPSGSVITVQQNGYFAAERASLSRNLDGAHLLDLSDGIGAPFSLKNALLASNGVDSTLIDTTAGGVIDSCTITNNDIGAASVILLESDVSLTLKNSIVWQPGKTTLAANGPFTGGANFTDAIVTDGATLDPSVVVSNVHSSDPLFAGPNSSNYHLQLVSPAVDYAAAGVTVDLEGNHRGKSLLRPNTPFDIGAYERQNFAPVTFPNDENFDELDAGTLPQGWTAATAGASSGWVVSRDYYDSTPLAANTGDPAGISDSTLATPPFHVNRYGRLSFNQFFRLEPNFDGAVLEIKIRGSEFQDIVVAGGQFIAGGYNGTLAPGNPLGAGRAIWTGDTPGFLSYQAVVVDLPMAANGQDVQVRWRVGTNATNPSNVGYAGYFLDDIHVDLDRPPPDKIFMNGFDAAVGAKSASP